jgi:hypothetical protein
MQTTKAYTAAGMLGLGQGLESLDLTVRDCQPGHCYGDSDMLHHGHHLADESRRLVSYRVGGAVGHARPSIVSGARGIGTNKASKRADQFDSFSRKGLVDVHHSGRDHGNVVTRGAHEASANSVTRMSGSGPNDKYGWPSREEVPKSHESLKESNFSVAEWHLLPSFTQ